MVTQAETGERILATARRLFHERGYNDVGINDICREAGVVKGSFYHFFPGKQDLLERVIEANYAALAEQLDKLDSAPLSGREKLLGQLHGVLDEARAQKKRSGSVLGCNLGALATELAVYNDGARRATRKAFRRWLRVLERMAAEGIDDGSLPPESDPAVVAASVLALLQGLSTLGRTFGDHGQMRSIVQLAEQHLLAET